MICEGRTTVLNQNNENTAVWWRNIWKVKAPNKMKIFLCRAMHGILLVMSSLAKKQLQVDQRCFQCARTDGNRPHAKKLPMRGGSAAVAELLGQCN